MIHGSRPPPFSAVLLAGLALRPLPPGALQPLLAFAMRRTRRRHPNLFERLARHHGALFLIDPVDIPFAFLLQPDPEAPSLTAVADAAGVDATARISGPLFDLLDLLEGRVDGDALFFSRHIVVEGDTEAVLALRNAVDDAEIDVLGDLFLVLGPFGRPARRLARMLRGAARDVDAVASALLVPAMRRADQLSAEIAALREEVAALKRTRRPTASLGDGRRT